MNLFLWMSFINKLQQFILVLYQSLQSSEEETQKNSI